MAPAARVGKDMGMGEDRYTACRTRASDGIWRCNDRDVRADVVVVDVIEPRPFLPPEHCAESSLPAEACEPVVAVVATIGSREKTCVGEQRTVTADDDGATTIIA